MRSAATAVVLTLGIGLTQVGVFAAPITGTSPTAVSTTVDGSMAGTSAADQTSGGSTQAPAVAAGMPISDFAGVPLMLVSPPQVFSLAPHGKLRGGSLIADDAIYGMTVGGGGGGSSSSISNLGFQAGGTTTSGGGGASGQTIPEPATLLLLGPAAALAIRRHFKRQASN